MKIQRFRLRRHSVKKSVLVATSHSAAVPRHSVPKQVIASGDGEQSISAYLHFGPEMRGLDASLLERARTLWQIGDWSALADLGRQPLEQHPLRAKLALLVGSALHQLNQPDEAALHLDAAQRWGCPKAVVIRALMAGALNNLGRAHALSGRMHQASESFAAALAIALPGSEHRATIQARFEEQRLQLGLSGRTNQSPPLVELSSVAESRAPRRFDALIQSQHPLDYLLRRLDSAEQPLAKNQQAEKDLLARIDYCIATALETDIHLPLELSQFSFPEGGTTIVHVQGDYIPRRMLKEGYFYESDFLLLLQHFHSHGGLIVDVGANIGNHTIFFAKVLQADVLAFEPVPQNFICLEVNLRLNSIQDRVKVFRNALGNTTGDINLAMAVDQNYGTFSKDSAAQTQSGGDRHAIPIRARICRLDEIIESDHSDRRIDLIKIDVEGMELDVLQGAAGILRVHQPLIACECFSDKEFAGVEAFLAPLGYTAVAMRNATPTFIFLNTKKPSHMSRLAQYLRTSALSDAARVTGFTTP